MIEKNQEIALELFENTLDSNDSICLRSDCLRAAYSLPTMILNISSYSKNGIKNQKNIDRFIEIVFDQPRLNPKILAEMSPWLPKRKDYHEKIRRQLAETRDLRLLEPLANFGDVKDLTLLRTLDQRLVALSKYWHGNRNEIDSKLGLLKDPVVYL
ncbi:hypothetical protein [Flavobacterium sp.]|uniref:hypothetical protein n=1 Tax=Flavobacterium sp. TaxID=239 RepID=UPI00121F3D30|nr:hypothetical protein [Flavobacterium sp.]RZJ69075.1 MAG: hypothetical protein EOO49_18695 [Flavobacterium sp.]